MPPGSIPGYNSSSLLLPGERVQVVLANQLPGPYPPLTGAILGTDAYGLLIEDENAFSTFVPWSNISTVTKLKA